MLSAASIIILLIGFLLFKTIIIVPERENVIVERLGKYSKTLEAGFHILAPFLDRVAYRHTLKEQAVDVPPDRYGRISIPASACGTGCT